MVRHLLKEPATSQEDPCTVTLDGNRNAIQIGEMYQGLKKVQHTHIGYHVNIYCSDIETMEDGQIYLHLPTTVANPKVCGEVNFSMFEGNIQFYM